MGHAWFSRFVTVVLVGGLSLVGSGLGITSAAAAPPVKEDALAGVTQNWDKALPANERFVILAAFNNEAVRDNNTGLVWERSPATVPNVWFEATRTCLNKNIGGQKGWRLPAIPELASLIDPSVAPPGPTLPVGNPFTNVLVDLEYWTATTLAVRSDLAWIVSFIAGNTNESQQAQNKHAWCVRGPMNADTY